VNRLEGELGHCGIGKSAWVASYGPHLGEEDPLRGWRGSGTIFFSGCNLNCVFCQNADISQRLSGKPASASELAQIMLELQARGCHNINLVSPTHVSAQILEAIYSAAISGLRLPVVYNSGGYDSVHILKYLDQVIDIYMPDMKYDSPEWSEELSGVRDYPEINRRAILEMHRQVGDLEVDENGIAIRGLLIRHLVLPNGKAGSEGVLNFIANQISKDTYLNIMDQYRPAYQACQFNSINRNLSPDEYFTVVDLAKRLGLNRLD
jgi:putative pyruvate formate lyase activating enzyme